MSRLSEFGHALYEGRASIDFVGRKWRWYAISAAIVAVAVFGLVWKGLNWGIEFEGGVEYRVAVASAGLPEVETIRDAVAQLAQDEGIDNASSPLVNTSGEDIVRVQVEPLTNDEANAVSAAIADATGVDPRDDISQSRIGPSWGAQVADRAITGLAVFLVLVVLLMWAYFREWKMSVAGIVALAHDVVITIGVYALSGFEVTPATVTGVLTILGFSLYDTVVVFDKVRENTKNLARTRMTYGEAANLAVNQTLVRSINTSIVALLPVGALLYAGVVTLGSGSLKDLALALFVGMAAGLYSSIFIATPLLVQLKELEPGVRAGDARARRHRSRREADRFAEVPVFTESMALHDEPAGGGLVVDDELGDLDDGVEPAPDRTRSAPTGVPGRFTAGERPPSSRPVSDSKSSHRPQPTRKPRSQRGRR